jgi:hypothetical protein
MSRKQLRELAKKDAELESLKRYLGSHGQKFDLGVLTDDDLQELLRIYWKAVLRDDEPPYRVRVGVDLRTLTDQERGRWQRLQTEVYSAPTGRDRPKPKPDGYQRKLHELAIRALGLEKDPDAATELGSWAANAEATGAVMASRELWEQHRDGIIDGDDLTVLWYCLRLIQEGGGGEAVVQGRALGTERAFNSCLDHLTVNEWLDSKREDRRSWRIRLGPLAHAERLRLQSQLGMKDVQHPGPS